MRVVIISPKPGNARDVPESGKSTTDLSFADPKEKFINP